MVLLVIYTNSSVRRTNKNSDELKAMKFESIDDAIKQGQASGTFYEVIDTCSGRVIDWNEINIKEEEEWFYDESEMIWKKYSEVNAPEKVSQLVVEWFANHSSDFHLCNIAS